MEYNCSNFLIEVEVPGTEVIISRTDLKGNITFANDMFAYISGYSIEELIGKPHNILRHPDMPKVIFKQMWESLENNQKWEGLVKNLRKDHSFYWVYAQVSGVYKDGKLVEYKSIRTPITCMQKKEIQAKYDQIKIDTGDTIRTISYN
ncbi:MAG: PAS domain-containing protein [Campylobacteraceae bacterium]|jgi:aerotaxis receptor|nr:PAS domain-containing protein [Campylobacteraceae bacterium]MBT3882790.1 PAS domain-containing protein [Campylobacteraceae bacterium]MBT4030758.1 PAS domain-containing protein [Campylobacteraceae bacterium]MBT4179695.1 PAS domain-containing protein [Campylobacteraceae bacterium]MBT4573131.1 PAS domain-containing protein [Campylobacteraceae bacterium]